MVHVWLLHLTSWYPLATCPKSKRETRYTRRALTLDYGFVGHSIQVEPNFDTRARTPGLASFFKRATSRTSPSKGH